MNKPEFNYAKFPFLPPNGMRSEGNYKYRTVSLFLEKCPIEDLHDCLWTLHDEEVYSERLQRWVPSARQVYVNALDEYDALRKLVGSVRGWEVLKSCIWFSEKLLDWELEHAYKQRSMLRAYLLASAQPGTPGAVTAVRTLLQIIDKKPVGRPKKPARPEPNEDAETVDKDHERVVQLFGKG